MDGSTWPMVGSTAARCGLTKAFVAATMLATLSGCVQYGPIPGTESSDSDTRGTAPVTFVSSQAPEAAAKCVIRNIEDKMFTMTPRMMEPERPGYLEVRARSEVGIAAIVGILTRSQGGSNIEVRISNHYLTKQRLARSIAKDC
jgi:hypothetical protein